MYRNIKHNLINVYDILVKNDTLKNVCKYLDDNDLMQLQLTNKQICRELVKFRLEESNKLMQ